MPGLTSGCLGTPAPPNCPFKEAQIPSNRDQKALKRGTLGVNKGPCTAYTFVWILRPYVGQCSVLWRPRWVFGGQKVWFQNSGYI